MVPAPGLVEPASPVISSPPRSDRAKLASPAVSGIRSLGRQLSHVAISSPLPVPVPSPLKTASKIKTPKSGTSSSPSVLVAVKEPAASPVQILEQIMVKPVELSSPHPLERLSEQIVVKPVELSSTHPLERLSEQIVVKPVEPSSFNSPFGATFGADRGRAYGVIFDAPFGATFGADRVMPVELSLTHHSALLLQLIVVNRATFAADRGQTSGAIFDTPFGATF